MKLVKQEDRFGCGVACVAAVLNTDYQNALTLFKDGQEHVRKRGFYCKEIVEALTKGGLAYSYKYIKPKLQKKIYKPDTIVFIKRSPRYPHGHYLSRAKNQWTDSWINYPAHPRQAGFRKRLPGKPIYVIYL